MSVHFNYATGRSVLSEQLIPIGNNQYYDIYEGQIVFSRGLVPSLIPLAPLYDITYSINKLGGGVFDLRTTGAVNYDVTWGDGATETSTAQVLGHTYAPGAYVLGIDSDLIYRPRYANGGSVTNITRIAIGPDALLGPVLIRAWQGATFLTSFSCPSVVSSTWTDISFAWGRSGLTSFPLMDVSSVRNFASSWADCPDLTTWPANFFDVTGTLVSAAFNLTWRNSGLSAQSIENILVSLDTNGQSGITLALQGGTNANTSTWSAAADTAYVSLVGKGWTIAQNGPAPV